MADCIAFMGAIWQRHSLRVAGARDRLGAAWMAPVADPVPQERRRTLSWRRDLEHALNRPVETPRRAVAPLARRAGGLGKVSLTGERPPTSPSRPRHRSAHGPSRTEGPPTWASRRRADRGVMPRGEAACPAGNRTRCVSAIPSDGLPLAARVTQKGDDAMTRGVEQANQALIERAYDAFARGDIPTVLDILADDILWHVPGRGSLSRDYHGHAEVLEFFKRFTELSGGTFRIVVDSVLAKGERVVVLVTESARRTANAMGLAAGPCMDRREREGDRLLAVPGRPADRGRVLGHVRNVRQAERAWSESGPFGPIAATPSASRRVATQKRAPVSGRSDEEPLWRYWAAHAREAPGGSPCRTRPLRRPFCCWHSPAQVWRARGPLRTTSPACGRVRSSRRGYVKTSAPTSHPTVRRSRDQLPRRARSDGPLRGPR